MQFSNDAVETATSSFCNNKNHTSTSNNDCTLVDTNVTPMELRPIFKALKGYSLYTKDVKLQAVGDFLSLSSYTSMLQSNQLDLVSKLKNICEGPSQVAKNMKRGCKWSHKWTGSFCAKFIIEVSEIIEEDWKCYHAKSLRKSSRKSLQSSLPPPAASFISMVETARLKIQGEIMTKGTSYQTRKRKTSTFKSVQDMLLKGAAIHNPNFVEVTQDKIEANLICPLCNHRSLVSVTSKEQATAENERIQKAYKRKFEEWSTNGSVGRKPRMEKTHSQILGCVCFMQNCVGNNDGSGCFKCFSDNGSKNQKQDER